MFLYIRAWKVRNYIDQIPLQLDFWILIKFYQGDALVRDLEGRNEVKALLLLFMLLSNTIDVCLKPEPTFQ